MSLKYSRTTADYLIWSDAMNLIRKLANDNNHVISLLVAIGCFTGLRISDILSLRWFEILDKDEICITEKKTGKQRMIRFNPQLKLHINECYIHMKPIGCKSPVFISRKGTVFSVQRINVILKQLKIKYHLRIGNISCHTLRKTFGRQVYMMNGDNSELALVKLMELFNHSSVSITKRYLGLRQEELLNILSNPKVKNADKPGGILLYGPPGTGKTLLATAIAGEAGVPLISTNGSSFNEIYVGAGAKNVRDIYAQARNLARASASKTAIVFIDEADAVAGKRSNSSNREGNATLNALLGELDGVQSKEESDIKVITIFATNRHDMFDSAFRKGRIDLEFKIDDPRFSEKARREILEINAKEKPFKDDTEKKKLLDNLAKSTAGLSGAELADIIKRAYRKTLYKGRQIPYITQKDITEAKLESIVGIKNDSEKTEYELKKTRAHEAGHAINQIILNHIFKDETQKAKQPVQTLDFIVNESRGDASGLTMMKPTDNNRITVESLLSSLAVNYGGYSVEEKLFDCHTDGVSSDLKNSTDLIMQATTEWGLGSKTKYIGCDTSGVTFELFKPDIKNDIIRYSNAGMEISDMITDFSQPFIQDYIEKLSTGPLANADIITGERFEKMFNDWMEKNNKQRAFEQLSCSVKHKIRDFKEEMKTAGCSNISA